MKPHKSSFKRRHYLEMIREHGLAINHVTSFGLDQNLDAIADTGRLNDTIFELLRWAESRGKIAALVIAARNSNPDNPALRRVAEEFPRAEGVRRERRLLPGDDGRVSAIRPLVRSREKAAEG